MVFGLLCRWSCNVCSYLYPAYASYKALSLHPEVSPVAMAQVERWLMYWAVVGTWTAVESVIGWTFTWLPFYSLFKTLFFLSLSLPQSEGSSYVYRAHLAPFFSEHERDIDAFLSSLRGRATEGLSSGVGWVWQKVKAQLNITLPDDQLQAAGMLAQSQPGQGGLPAQGVQQPPTLSDPASGAMQTAVRFMSRYAGQYVPVAITALSAAAASAKGQSQQTATRSIPESHSRNSSLSSMSEPSIVMPIPVPTPGVHQKQSDPSLRSRTFAHASAQLGSSYTPPGSRQGAYPGSNPSLSEAQQAQYAALASARSPPPGFGGNANYNRSVSSPAGPASFSGNQRISPYTASNTSSDDSLGTRYEGYEQIGREDLQGMNEGRPGMDGRKGSWFGWGGGGGGAGVGGDHSRDKVE